MVVKFKPKNGSYLDSQSANQTNLTYLIDLFKSSSTITDTSFSLRFNYIHCVNSLLLLYYPLKDLAQALNPKTST